jgi:hypothetical protein
MEIDNESLKAALGLSEPVGTCGHKWLTNDPSTEPRLCPICERWDEILTERPAHFWDLVKRLRDEDDPRSHELAEGMIQVAVRRGV